MEKLIIKTVDSYSSKIFKGKTINEYIIYNALEDGTRISARTVMGDEQKNLVIADEIMHHLISGEELTIEEF
jgi:hypothetical protein